MVLVRFEVPYPVLRVFRERYENVNERLLNLVFNTGQTFFPTSCLIAGRQQIIKQLVSSA